MIYMITPVRQRDGPPSPPQQQMCGDLALESAISAISTNPININELLMACAGDNGGVGSSMDPLWRRWRRWRTLFANIFELLRLSPLLHLRPGLWAVPSVEQSTQIRERRKRNAAPVRVLPRHASPVLPKLVSNDWR